MQNKQNTVIVKQSPKEFPQQIRVNNECNAKSAWIWCYIWCWTIQVCI